MSSVPHSTVLCPLDPHFEMMCPCLLIGTSGRVGCLRGSSAGEQISLLCCAHMRLTVTWHWLHTSASVINEYRKCSSSKQWITGWTDSSSNPVTVKKKGGWWNEMHGCSQKDCVAFKEWLSLCWWVSVISGYFASFAWRSVNVHIKQVWTKYKPMPPKCSCSQPRDLGFQRVNPITARLTSWRES